jgi:hypothetical protein
MRKVLVLFVVFVSQTAFAQRIVFHDSVSHTTVAPQSASSMGRDFWFVAHNGTVNQDLVLSSERPTTALIQRMGQPIQRVAIGPWGSVKWQIPYLWTVTSSDDIERTAIHVWCDSVDLSLALVIEGDLSVPSDMLAIPPVTAWDNTYTIVAPGGGYAQQSYVTGSEFTIVADADSTNVAIVPGASIVSGYGSLAHKAGKPFAIILSRGQAVQYIAYQDSSLTGTQIVSDKPILVVAASRYGYPCDAMRGMHEWGTRYYSAPYPKSTYKIIATASQTIFRNGVQFCSLAGAGAIFTTTSIKDSASLWTSDAPFAIVQFPFGGAEVQLQALDQYPKRSIFSVLTAWNATTDINLFISRGAKTAMIDGRDIRTNATRIWRDSTRELYRYSLTSSYNSSRHLVESDSSAGIYSVCGGAGYALFACGTGTGLTHAIATDTTAPIIQSTQDGKCVTITVRDAASQLSGIIPDTAINFVVSSDAAFYSESGVTTLTCCLADTLRAASYSFTAYDGAGNASRYAVTYEPNPHMTHPGIAAVADKIDTCLMLYWTDFNVTVVDTSFVAMTVDNVWTDDPAFTFSAFSAPQNALPFELLPDSSHTLAFQFRPTQVGVFHAHAMIHTRPNAVTVAVPLTGVSLSWDADVSSHSEKVEPLVVSVKAGRLLIQPRASGSFSLFNTLGMTNIAEFLSPNVPVAFDISHFASGLYLYRFEWTDGTRTGELIIEN